MKTLTPFFDIWPLIVLKPHSFLFSLSPHLDKLIKKPVCFFLGTDWKFQPQKSCALERTFTWPSVPATVMTQAKCPFLPLSSHFELALEIRAALPRDINYVSNKAFPIPPVFLHSIPSLHMQPRPEGVSVSLIKWQQRKNNTQI